VIIPPRAPFLRDFRAVKGFFLSVKLISRKRTSRQALSPKRPSFLSGFPPLFPLHLTERAPRFFHSRRVFFQDVNSSLSFLFSPLAFLFHQRRTSFFQDAFSPSSIFLRRLPFSFLYSISAFELFSVGQKASFPEAIPFLAPAAACLNRLDRFVFSEEGRGDPPPPERDPPFHAKALFFYRLPRPSPGAKFFSPFFVLFFFWRSLFGQDLKRKNIPPPR